MKNYHEKNVYLLNHETNKTFEQVLWMNDEEFKQWCVDLRKAVVWAWDVLGIPPRVGYTTDEIIDQFKQLESFPVKQFLAKDVLTGNKDVIKNTRVEGNAVNSWFPTMMKTPINYTTDPSKGRSIYDFFARDDLLERFTTYARRHFKRDSFYAYSIPLQVNDKRFGLDLPLANDAIAWLYSFHEEGYEGRDIYSYWLAPTEEEREYTGYNEKLVGKKYLTITKNQIKFLKLDSKYTTNVTDKSDIYQIRVFKLGQKLFPAGFKAFKVSFCQYAVQFPPLTAKLIYEMYTEPGKRNIVWDPSMGWGGRLIGALSVRDDREITYLGNDPNEDHTIKQNYTKYHDVSYFYKKHIDKGGLFPEPHNETYFWQLGSEEMQHDTIFQSFKGVIDLVFTSPPYFMKEAYSNDPGQSYKKFTNWDAWCEGFLEPTLKTAYEWLRPGGHLCWNVSDVKFSNETLLLVDKSYEICLKLGFKHVITWKMCLAAMPGGNRMEKGLPKTKYFVQIDDRYHKYEPCLVFQK